VHTLKYPGYLYNPPNGVPRGVGEVGYQDTLGVKSPGYPQGGFCSKAGRREKVPLGYPGACSVRCATRSD
jgi:hypothetical protein